MDRRVLAGVALIAVLMAVGLGALLAPSGEPAPEGAPGTDPVASARSPRAPGRAADRDATRDRSPAARTDRQDRAEEPVPPWESTDDLLAEEPSADAPAGTLEIQCQMVQTKRNALEDLLTFEDEAADDPARQALLAARVAKIAAALAKDGKAMKSGELTCPGAKDLDLGHAADFLERSLPELEADEETLASIDRALRELDGMD